MIFMAEFYRLSVERNKGMLGTFAPQKEPYDFVFDEETTPSGVLARGTYSAKLKASLFFFLMF